ncbi:MAG TPA: kynureninase [Saprospiraceae bacterium]|nr:kynureninase [Saprospiraceae bacterium]HRJ14142.1 kynureninase [Saprospiraceae bacterium]HRK82545.1 kynureninase [Saprospiraceae bacterium]
MKTMFDTSADCARNLDAQDTLAQLRDQFYFPQHEGRDVLYFCGNSLGLQPKSVEPALLRELEHWRTHGVEGHFRGEMPWMHYHKYLQSAAAHVVGALPEEVVIMNTLTANLHLLMVSFYRPDARRFKIIMEAGAFPSDQYAMESQVRYHGYAPEEAIVEIAPRPGEETLRTEDVLETIRQHGPQTALVMMCGVQYYTGQWMDVEAITRAGHEAGALVGFDLAHAAGNIPMRLHDWQADFAVWCSYKYLNSGPGGPGGVFVHQRHADNKDLPRFAGWWGHDEERRFLMEKGFVPMRGAAGWQLSNAQIFSFAAHKASLDIFESAGMGALRHKSEQLTAYLEFLIDDLTEKGLPLHIITPRDPAQRGCQLSVTAGPQGRAIFDFLSTHGVVCDWREPDVIRLAPTPMYNSFGDVFALYHLLLDFLRRNQ